MNFYETRIAQLKNIDDSLMIKIQGRFHQESKSMLKELQPGTKIYPTIWFLRSINDIENVQHAAIHGLTIKCKSSIYDSCGEWSFGEWVGKDFDCYEFEEIDDRLSFKYDLSSMIWKIEPHVIV